MTEPTLLTRDECESTLSAHAEVLNQCFLTAWERWQEWLPNVKGSPADVSALTRAMALHDFIRAEVIKKFLGVPGVKIKDKRGLLVVCFHDRVVIRFKKFRGKSLKTSGNWNQQTAAFETHQLELPETSVQPVTHLVAGYLLDELAAGIEKVAVTCLVDGDHYWAPIEISSVATGHTATVHSGPAGDPTSAKPRVRSTRRKKDIEGA
ncbi:hypothetical protein OG205_35755 [Lentzea sp. NBC_00516]|uniref:hypothetical protein n=1 Tax=Lentzea sp. NBC_00516 TaxID=2903582 RepID=UPI002E804962|nr:hypothetical protein [Lentzea sp. NBC_00516]WUD23372.1 hypothetical protein OG205_35755 [Lentzea sp. NBC_00516]